MVVRRARHARVGAAGVVTRDSGRVDRARRARRTVFGSLADSHRRSVKLRTKRSKALHFSSGTLSLLLRATPRVPKVIRESCGSQRTHELPRERLAGRLRKVGGSPSYFSAHSHSEKSTTYAQKAVILQKLSLGELQSQV